MVAGVYTSFCGFDPGRTHGGLFLNSILSRYITEMDVSRTKIHLDTSIPATSNSGRRAKLRVQVYVGGIDLGS